MGIIRNHKSLFKVGEIVTHNNRRAEILGHEQSNLPCACCGRFDHNISLLAKILYLDDNSIELVEFSSLKGNNDKL